MIYTKLYIFQTNRKESIFGKGGVYRSFLLTSSMSPNFTRMLEHMDKPLYVLQPNIEAIAKSAGLNPLHSFYEALKFGEPASITPETMLIVPTGFTSLSVPAKPSGDSNPTDVEWYLRQGVNIKRALLVDKENPQGYLDPKLTKGYLGMFKQKSPRIHTKGFASASDIAKAIWNVRNDIRIGNYAKYWRANPSPASAYETIMHGIT